MWWQITISVFVCFLIGAVAMLGSLYEFSINNVHESAWLNTIGAGIMGAVTGVFIAAFWR